MSDLPNLISQLEKQQASIDRAIEALREITNTTTVAPNKSARSAPVQDSDGGSERGNITSAGRQKRAEAMKRRWAAKRAGTKKANKNANGNESTPANAAATNKGRSMTAEQKRAISKAWTPERKQRFAEFHVQRMARERGEDPAKALREYRRRKQKEQAGASAPRKTVTKKVARKSAVKKSATKAAAAS